MRRQPSGIEDWKPIFAKVRYRISQVVRRARMNRRSFQRNFKSRVGMSLRDAIKKCRFEHARELIALGYTNPEIARQLGFADAVHFCHAFKNYCRQSPQSLAPRWRRRGGQ